MSTHALDNYFDELLTPTTAVKPTMTESASSTQSKSATNTTYTSPPGRTTDIQSLINPSLRQKGEALRKRMERRRADEEAASKAKSIDRSSRWLRFELGTQSYAVELLKVQEVQRLPDIMPVRGSSSHVLGMMNLRGQIIAVIDLGRCLGLPQQTLTDAARVIVLEAKNETIGMLVASVAEVIALTESAIENPVGSIPALPREALIGIARHVGGISVLLEATAFLR